MDATTEYFSNYTSNLNYEKLSPGAIRQVKRTLIDTLGCGVGAFDAEPPTIARRIASRVRGNPPAKILGVRQETSMELAAFANTCLIRYLDCNDAYAGRGTGHPSDMIPGVLAVADAHEANGRAVITAVTAAYEAFCRMADQLSLKTWDQGVYVGLGTACGAGKILGLDRTALAHAIAIAVTASVPLRATRIGELSMWKGCATAAAVRLGVFAAELAAEGMTGPDQPFEGKEGLWHNLGAEAPEWPAFGGGAESFRITATGFKAYPSVIHTQGPIGLVLDLRRQVALEDIDSVHVATYEEALRRTASEPEKWNPETRETADHSIPYLLAAAWQDGEVTPASFAPSRIHDPALRTFIKKLRVTEDPDFTRRYPAESCSRIEVATTDGRRFSVETNYPKGHRRNPLTDQEVEGKFRGLACSALDTKGCDGVLAKIWHLDKAATLDRLFDSLVISR